MSANCTTFLSNPSYMSNSPERKFVIPWYLKITTILLGLILLVVIMQQAKSILVPILISGLLAILFSPVASWLEARRVGKTWSALISLVTMLALIGGVIFFFYNQALRFSADLAGIEERIGELVVVINNFLAEYIDGVVPISVDNIKEVIINQLAKNANILSQGIMATAETLTLLFIIPIYVFLFIFYRRFIIEFFLKAFPNKHETKVTTAIANIRTVVQKYIKGAFIVILILSVLNFTALSIIGIKHALLFAVFAGFLNVIPYVGPIIGSTLPIAYALLTTDSLWYPIAVFASFYVIQTIEGNFLTPKITGSQVSLNPLMTIIALFVGNFIWGLAGMILFVPGLAILKVIFDEIEGMEAYSFLLSTVKGGRRRSLKEQTMIAKLKNVLSMKKNNP
jgi:predicted PurR-regulated permease PerM